MGDSAGKEVALPWKELSLVEQRKAFVDAAMAKEESMTELCRRFGISRKTGYKWLSRFLAGCELRDRSRRPKSSPRSVAETIEDSIVAWRNAHPRWGPRKLRDAILRAHPDAALPSVSTFALIIARNGLVVPRKRRKRIPPSTEPLRHATEPNALWCIDFKGDFLVGGRRCFPLTITDACSRYLIACVALTSTKLQKAQRVLENAFRTFGLPRAIRSDNGVPFASVHGPLGMSELSVWWRKLGIKHERIEPGKPQQNGRHERMHLTLKLETASPPASTMRAQQRVFDRFRHEYNDDRPHEGLGGAVPGDLYERSPRLLPEPCWGKDFDYPPSMEQVRIDRLGRLSWNGNGVFVSTVLKHQIVGLERTKKGDWTVYFGEVVIGTLRRQKRRLSFERTTPPRKRRPRRRPPV